MNVRPEQTQAYQIARRALKRCVTRDGLVAGIHHFSDLWARDSLFSSFGANVSGFSKESKKTLETFLSYQRGDGLIPFLIRRDRLTIGKYFGHHSPLPTPKAQFRSSQSLGLVPDGGLMTVIAAFEYVRRSGNRRFFQTHRVQLVKAMQWYENRFGDDLISEWFLCEWADAVLKVGKTLYTNILYWRALGDIGKKSKQQVIGQKIRAAFWNGRYFADWIDWKRQDYFAAHGNMLAIVFGFTNAMETNYPSYPPWRIAIIAYATGLADYHNRGCLWLQPGILYSIALYRSGFSTDARVVLSRIAEKIDKHHDVYEVYERSGKPVHRTLYQSEQSFAWSAGLFLWASHILGKV